MVCKREGLKKKLEEFSTKCHPSPPLNKKKKNDLLAMKRILYDMGPMTLVIASCNFFLLLRLTYF